MDKTKFRNTKQWQEFRLKLKRERKIDYITQKPLRKGFNCHHKDMNPANYENLNPENFEVLRAPLKTYFLVYLFIILVAFL